MASLKDLIKSGFTTRQGRVLEQATQPHPSVLGYGLGLLPDIRTVAYQSMLAAHTFDQASFAGPVMSLSHTVRVASSRPLRPWCAFTGPRPKYTARQKEILGIGDYAIDGEFEISRKVHVTRIDAVGQASYYLSSLFVVDDSGPSNFNVAADAPAAFTDSQFGTDAPTGDHGTTVSGGHVRLSTPGLYAVSFEWAFDVRYV